MDGDAARNGEEEARNRDELEKDPVEPVDRSSASGIEIAEFDYSVGNFFSTMERMSALCGAPGEESFEATEIERFSSMTTFLKEWRDFYYEPKIIDFVYESGSAPVKNNASRIILPQFSSAAVPKMEQTLDRTEHLDSYDFVLNAGGLVWALDWCPGIRQNPDSNIKCEYLAVGAHPPGSTYHKIGAPLIGRGVIQIWYLLNLDEMVEFSDFSPPRPRGRPRKNPILRAVELNDLNESSTGRPKGRPRKQPPACVDVVNCKDELPSFSENQSQSMNESILPKGKKRPRKEKARGEQADDVNSVKVSLTPKPRGRPRKSPVGENVTRRPRGRPKKNPVLRAVELNDLNESSTGRPRGRPRKQPPVCVDVVNCKDELPSFSENQSQSMNESILPLIVDSGGSALALSVPADVNCEEESIQRRRRGRPRRGRPRKQLPPSVDASNAKGESPSCSNNQIQYVNESILPCSVDSGNAALASSVPADVKDSIQPKHGGRPRKRRPPSIDVVDEVKNQSPSQRNNQIRSVTESILPLSVDSGNIATTLSVPSDVNCKVESVQRRCRGRHRKNAFPSVNDCVPPSGVQLRKDTSTLLTSSKSGALNQNVPLAGCQTDKFSMAMCEEIDTGILARKSGSNSCTKNIRITGKPVAVTSNTVTDQTQLIVNTTELSDAVLPETCQNTISGRCQADGDHLARSSGQTACILEKMVEEKETTVAREDSGYPILPTSKEDGELAKVVPTDDNKCQDPMILGSEVAHEKSAKTDLTSSSIPKEIAFPRVVLCLAHNGKVAWDVKWKPQGVNNSEGKRHMGYLAVLLGNGSLEVWEVPLPGMVRVLYTSGCSMGTDPRFLKLEPVFRCSKVKRGDRQSIPLTLEWSPSVSHDLILAGCHDGTVALWQFSTQYSSQDTKPLLYFNADSVPIRAVAWAPKESDAESTNLFVTAGHEGLKFWDLRTPYRPLWGLNPVQRPILSLDWLRDPRCIILSFDDGTLRFLSLSKAANDVPVTGKPFAGPKFQGLHSYPFSSSAIWSIHVSRTTGLAAYCSADGSAVRFQLTAKSADKDPKRNHMPRFLCGSLIEGGQALKVNTPLLNTTFQPKKCLVECGETTRTVPGNLSDKDQAKQENSPATGDGPLLLGFGARTTTLEPTKIKKKETDSSGMAHQALISCDGDQEVSHRNGDEGSVQAFEVFPSKVVAMHRVRWNMNKGSERWLCYGGAAGIVRCQQIPFTTMR